MCGIAINNESLVLVGKLANCELLFAASFIKKFVSRI